MEQATLNPTPTRRLVRGDGPISGVAAGLADYFQVDPVLVRLGLVATAIVAFPAVPIAYVAAWLIIPKPDLAGEAPTAVPPTVAETPPIPVPPAPAPWADAPAPMPVAEDTASADAPAAEPAVETDADDEPGTDEESGTVDEETTP